MLVLTRKVDESLMFGPEATCKVTVREIKPLAVRLQFSDIPEGVVLSTQVASDVSSGKPLEYVLRRDEWMSVAFTEPDGAVDVGLVDCRGDKVRLGIDTPKDWPVHRKEVYDAIRRYQEEGE